MRLVQWTDQDGYIRRAYVRNNDPDDVAKTSGIQHDPPDINELDWDEIRRELHNLLADRGLITWADVQAQQNGLSAAILNTMKRRLTQLYRR